MRLEMPSEGSQEAPSVTAGSHPAQTENLDNYMCRSASWLIIGPGPPSWTLELWEFWASAVGLWDCPDR